MEEQSHPDEQHFEARETLVPNCVHAIDEDRNRMSKKPDDPIHELIARLKSDPGFAARRNQERRETREQMIAANRVAEAPVVEALQRAGIGVTSVWDLVNGATPYRAALPVLIEELSRPYTDEVIDGIARALAVPDAAFAWPILVEEYRKRSSTKEAALGKEGLAVALSATVTKDTIDELIQLARDPTHGESRLLLLRGIQRSRTPQAKKAIEELASDPQFMVEIASWSRKRKVRPNSIGEQR